MIKLDASAYAVPPPFVDILQKPGALRKGTISQVPANRPEPCGVVVRVEWDCPPITGSLVTYQERAVVAEPSNVARRTAEDAEDEDDDLLQSSLVLFAIGMGEEEGGGEADAVVCCACESVFCGAPLVVIEAPCGLCISMEGRPAKRPATTRSASEAGKTTFENHHKRV